MSGRIKRLSPQQLEMYYLLLEERTGPCEDWTGHIDEYGYGVTDSGQHAHRAVWEKAHDCELPEDIVVRHRCDNKACINLEHLVPGTRAENSRDAVIRGGIKCGEQRWNSKLTEADIQAILASSEGIRTLAKRYGITHQWVSRIKRRAAWKHVRPGKI